MGRGAPIILSAVRTVLCNLLVSDFVAEPNQTVIEVHKTFTFTFNHLADAFIQSDVQMRRTIEAIEDRFSDGRVEPFQLLLWQVKLPQLAMEVQPLLGLFCNGVYVIVPLQVLGDGGAQEPE